LGFGDVSRGWNQLEVDVVEGVCRGDSLHFTVLLAEIGELRWVELDWWDARRLQW